jgi:hypothetical protein
MISQEDAQANAGSLAAASVVVSKQIPLRDPLRAGLPPRFRPSGLGDLPRLFSQDDTSPARRLARLSAAALVYSVNKKDRTQTDKVLRDDERGVVDTLHLSTAQQKTDRSCPHCHMLLSTLYGKSPRWRAFPPIAVVNHQAKVAISFDPETNISEASIKNFQVIVPKAVATKLISLSHPLHWAQTAGAMFRRSDPVEADGSQGEEFRGDRKQVEERWEERARSTGEAFIFEDVGWPVNEQLSADSENVIRIFDFTREGDLSLDYKYSLERCIRTNFGIAWEPSGLDIDGGEFSARAVPLDTLSAFTIGSQYKADDRLPRVTRRDIYALEAQQNASIYETLAQGWSVPDSQVGDVVEKLPLFAKRLAAEWPDLAPFYLLDVSASKEIHFTIPEVSPIDLWQNLTYTAPAILFTFLNRAVCHAPHLLLEGHVDQGGGVSHAI